MGEVGVSALQAGAHIVQIQSAGVQLGVLGCAVCYDSTVMCSLLAIHPPA